MGAVVDGGGNCQSAVASPIAMVRWADIMGIREREREKEKEKERRRKTKKKQRVAGAKWSSPASWDHW